MTRKLKKTFLAASMATYLSCAAPELVQPVVVDLQRQDSPVVVKENERVILTPIEKIADNIMRKLERRLEEPPRKKSIIGEIPFKYNYNNQSYTVFYAYTKRELCDDNQNVIHKGLFSIDFIRNFHDLSNSDWIQISAKAPSYDPEKMRVLGGNDRDKEKNYYQLFPEAHNLYHLALRYLDERLEEQAQPVEISDLSSIKEESLLGSYLNLMKVLPNLPQREDKEFDNLKPCIKEEK